MDCILAEVLNLLEALHRERGLTLVTVSHDLGVITPLRERMLVMQRSAADLAVAGVAQGTTRE